MNSNGLFTILLAIVGLISICGVLYQTDSKKREGFIQILVLLALGSLYLVLINEIDNTHNKLIKKFTGAILFIAFVIISFIYGYRKNGKN
jgi:predicted membrane channel-forming protein YqfA (hemolysin III family)